MILFSSISEKEDNESSEIHQCIQILGDKVSFLSRHRAEFLDKNPKLEAANEQLRKELEENNELIKFLYRKLQLEKQVKSKFRYQSSRVNYKKKL